MRPVITTILFILISHNLFSQVAISNNAATADANTMLDIKSSNKGVKFPRLTTAQRKAIPVSNEDAGLMVFDTDKQCLYMYNGNQWQPFAYAAGGPANVLNQVYPPAGSFKAYHYGDALSVNGELAAVGAEGDTATGNIEGAGSVFMYKKINGTWTMQQRLQSPIPAISENFGSDVCISGNYLAVGASGHKNTASGQGAVYIYFYNGSSWQFKQKILAPDAGQNEYFGGEIAMNGLTMIVGASNAKVAANTRQGAAYTFSYTLNGWIFQHKLVAPDGTTDSYFGSSIAVEGDYIVIGAAGAMVSGNKKGAAYVFVWGGGTWTMQKKLFSETVMGLSGFGNAVSIEGDQVLVGSQNEPYGGFSYCGLAYLFKRTGANWSLKTTFHPSAGASDLRYGLRLALKNGYAIISASMQYLGDIQPGRVYLYKLTNEGSRFLKFIDIPNPTNYDYWASDIAFDGNTFLISSTTTYRHPQLGTETGVAYFGTIDD